MNEDFLQKLKCNAYFLPQQLSIVKRITSTVTCLKDLITFIIDYVPIYPDAFIIIDDDIPLINQASQLLINKNVFRFGVIDANIVKETM